MIKVTVEKVLDRIEWAAEATHGNNLSKRKGMRRRLLRAEHSPIRALWFAVEMTVPTFVAVHLVRHTQGTNWWVQSNRNDRPWADPSPNRETPVTVRALLNAQALINIARKRLCYAAHAQTVEAIRQLKKEIEQIDPDLSELMVPECVYRNGVCSEPKSCALGPRRVMAEYGKRMPQILSGD